MNLFNTQLKLIKIVIIIISVFTLTGCNNSREIEDKKFALGVGIDLSYSGLKVTYEFPELSKEKEDSGEGSAGNLFQSTVDEFYEAEKEFYRNSNKALDYKHLKALIIGKELLEEKEKLEEYILYIEKNSLYPWNTLVFIGDSTAENIFLESSDIDTSLGEYLNKMYANGEWSEGGEMITLRDLIHHYYSKDQVLLIPAITNNEENGGNPIIVEYKIMKNFQYVGELSLEEMDLALIGDGKGEKKVFTIPVKENFYVVEISKIRRKVSIRQQKNIPVAYITFIGEARVINKDIPGAIELDSLQEEFNHQLEVMVSKLIINEKEKAEVDILNSFRILGRKNRSLWLKYHEEQNRFEENLQYVITSDLNLL